MIPVEFLDELEALNLALKKDSTEALQGRQRSPQSGSGMLFKDHKEYIPGDDIRRMDWKAYARTEDLYVKRFEEEKSVTVHVLVDRSSSMDYGDENKYDYAAKLGLALAHFASNSNDRFRYSVFSETVSNLTADRRNADLAGLVEALNELPKTPESRIRDCVTSYTRHIQHSSAVVIISDFLTDINQIEDALSMLNTEAFLVQTLSRRELEPEIQGDRILRDPESDSKLRTFLTPSTRRDYRQDLESHMHRIQEATGRNGGDYLLAPTDKDIFSTFLELWNLMKD